MIYITAVYNAAQPGDCTEAFTQAYLLSKLGLAESIQTTLRVILTVVGLLGVVSNISSFVFSVITYVQCSHHLIVSMLGICDPGCLGAASQQPSMVLLHW